MEVEFLVLPNGKCPTEIFFNSLDNKTLAKIYKLVERMKAEGKLIFPHARKLEGYKDLWELRISSQQGAVRVFYIYDNKESVVFVCGFIKKSQKTPKRELNRVINYLKSAGVI